MYVKIHQFLSDIKKMHTKENWFLFFCLTVYIQPCTLIVILLVLSGCQILICFLLRLFALHLAPAASALELLKFVNNSLRQHHPSLSLWLIFPCSYYISLCRFISLTVHDSLTLSLPTQNLPLSQLFPVINSLPAPELTLQTSWVDRFFRAPRFSFLIR